MQRFNMPQIRFQPEPAGGAHELMGELVSWGGYANPPHSPPTRRLRRLDLGAFSFSESCQPS